MGIEMGFGFGIASPTTVFMRKHRWLFKIPSVSAEPVSALPPFKGARPSLQFKEMEAQHMTETIYYPGKPEWKPIPLVLYELKRSDVSANPVWDWLKQLYDPEQNSRYNPSAEGFKKPEAILEMYDGAGEVCERWKFETIWCQNVEFGDLDMSSSEVVTCELTLRYDRAYIMPD
jgi:hypothetical protein